MSTVGEGVEFQAPTRMELMNVNNWNNYDVKKNEEIEVTRIFVIIWRIIIIIIYLFIFFLWLELWNSSDASVQRNRAHRSSADDEKVDKNQEK
jgi:hypothetical protein